MEANHSLVVEILLADTAFPGDRSRNEEHSSRHGSILRTMKMACLLLAAGAGSRLGGRKPLALLHGQPLCLPALRAARDSEIGPVSLVIPSGNTGRQIREVVGGLAMTFVENPESRRGMLSSFQAGLRALPSGVDAVILALADMPGVTPDSYQALKTQFQVSQPPLVLTRYGGQLLAPPHLFRADLIPEILALPDADQGPRAVVQRYMSQAVFNERTAAESFDVDTPEALAQAQMKISL